MLTNLQISTIYGRINFQLKVGGGIMNWSLPYFGKKGTIKRIDFNNKEYTNKYIVYRYGCSSDEEAMFMIPKNETNMKLLIDNYYKELEDYLETYKSLYDDYTSSSNKRINKRLVSLIFIISIFMALLSIPFLATHTALGFIGVSLDVISFPIIGIGINLLIKEHDEEKKHDFIRRYKEYSNRYRVCARKDKENNTPTKYSAVTKDRTCENDLRLIKELKKNS